MTEETRQQEQSDQDVQKIEEPVATGEEEQAETIEEVKPATSQLCSRPCSLIVAHSCSPASHCSTACTCSWTHIAKEDACRGLYYLYTLSSRS
jgi:hypothetical protein